VNFLKRIKGKVQFLKKLLSLLLICCTSFSFGVAQSDMEILRGRVMQDKLSAEVNANEVQTLVETLNPEGYWSGINYSDVSRIAFENRTHVLNIWLMSLAYRKTDSGFSGNSSVKDAIEKAIDYWLANDFVADNWHTNEIANPTSWLDILYLMDENLDSERVKGISGLAGRANLKAWGARPGGDLIKIAGLAAELALFHRDEAELKRSVDAMVAEVAITSGMGIKPDLGFHHRSDRVTSILAYGTGYAATFADWGRRLAGTKFQFSEQSTRLLVDYFLDGICKSMVHAAFKDPGVINRGMSREGSLAPLGPEIPLRLLSFTSYRKGELENVAAIRQGTQSPNLTHNRFFWFSEYSSHQRPGYFTSVRMHSDRNNNMESPHNQESLKMHHYADGSNFISRTGKEYFDIFPVWDWQKIPGTTVVQKPELPHWNQIVKPGKTGFVGAVSDGIYGISVFDFQSPHDPLAAKKAWFFFDNEYVCLGTSIVSDSQYPVVTTLNQTLSHSPVQIQSKVGNQILTNGEQTVEEVSWVIQDSVGYFFPEPSTAHLDNREKSGLWQSIANSQRIRQKPSVTKKIFSLWIDHGIAPQGAAYTYSIHPNVSSEDMIQLTTDPGFQVLSNTSEVQAVWHKGLNLGQLVFYQAGRVVLPNGKAIVSSTAALVMVKMNGLEINEITVADPSRKLKELDLEIEGNFDGYGPFWLASSNKTGTSKIRILLPEWDQAGKSVCLKNHSSTGIAGEFPRESDEEEKMQVAGNALSGRRYLGEHFGGGVIIWLDETGDHGLIASKNDQHGNVSWRNGRALIPQLYGDHGDRFINAVSDGIYAGKRNTLINIAQQTADNISGEFAAQVCAVCKDGNYGDWYLPAKAELDILFLQKDQLGGFGGDMYWSSSEYNIGFVWGQNFKGYGGQYPLNKGSEYAIRCVREF